MHLSIKKHFRMTHKGNEKGFTLLEYCAGAAVLITIVWGALTTLGNDLGSFLQSIGSWAKNQASQVDTIR